MPREVLLARALVELADTLVADFDVVELLTRLADRCVEVLGVGAAGLMLAGPRRAAGHGFLQRGHAGIGALRAAGQRRTLPGLLPKRPTGHASGPRHAHRPLAPFRC